MPSDLDILILAAGKGSRMKSDLPKVLHPLMGRPLIDHVLDEAEALSPREIGVIVGHGRDLVKEALAPRGVSFVVQREQKGTGHAVRSAAKTFGGRDGHVVVLSGDVPLLTAATLKALVSRHKRAKARATVMTAVLDDPGSLGRVVRDGRGRLECIVEARDADPEQLAIQEINSGIYCFRSQDLFDGLKKLKKHAGSGEFYLTDVVKDLVAAGEKVVAFAADDPSEAMGINTQQDRLAAQEALKARIFEAHTAAGVEIIDPSLTFIDKGVTIGPGTVILPFSAIMGHVSIGARCRVGPYAHLRPGTVLEDGAAVGNFVETKDATLGEDSLALHLAYLGDATVGRGVNIGAGTITANYDGQRKNRTHVGDGAFVGSGSVLVAPVDIGQDATVGAGSVVPARQHVADGQTVVGVPARPLEKERRQGAKRKRSKHVE